MSRKLQIIALLNAVLLFQIGCSVKSKSNPGNAERNYIHIVGSSTISPLMSSVSEEFSRSQSLKNNQIVTPVVESNGTRSGFEMFCAGVGKKYPDFVNASRPIEKREFELCNKNGVKEIVEIKIGYDGIVFGDVVGRKKIKLTKEQIFLALAEKVFDEKTQTIILNPYKYWSDIDPSLPATEIVVYGPPLTSGTRDVFADMVMEDVCWSKKEFIDAYPSYHARREQCNKIRNDGRFIESGENDSLLVRSLKDHPDSFGIFGFNFLVSNASLIQAVPIDNVIPSADTIASKRYKLSRPLFVYFKKQHLDLLPEMRNFVKEIINPETIGKKGYLIHSGLVALQDKELKRIRNEIISTLEAK